MKAARARILSLSLAVCLSLGMALYLPGPFEVSAALPPYGDNAEGKPWDGIDFEALVASNSGIYYGVYDHYNGFDYPDGETPILWRVWGEEANNERLTLMSEYLLDAKPFYPHSGNYQSTWGDLRLWENAYLNKWLNNEEFTSITDVKKYDQVSGIGFLDSFDSTELDLIEEPSSITTKYKSGTDTNHEITPKKIWLPATNDWLNNVSGDVSWHANLNNAPVSIAQIYNRAAYKDGTSAEWWLRAPNTTGNISALFVHILGGTGEAKAVNNVLGVRPAFQLNPSSVLFISELLDDVADKPWATQADGTDYTANSPDGAQNYKLTILSTGVELDGLTHSRGSLTGDGGETLSVAPGGSLNLTGAIGGGAHKLVYKIVDRGSGSIVGYGTGDNTSITIDGVANVIGTDDLTETGDYTLYVWAQKDGGIHSHVGSKPMWFMLNVEPDTTPPTVEGVTPSGTGISLGTSSLSITFDEDMKTTAAGTVDINNGADVENGVWENRTITYDLSGLDYSTTYNISISGFQDKSGNIMLPDNSHSFTTVDAPPPGQHTVTVAASPPQGGNPKASPANATPDEQIPLTANPNTDWRFDGWSSISLGVSFGDAAAQTTTFSMPDNDVEVTASYTYIGGPGNTYTVTYAANGATSGSVPVDGRHYDPGDMVTVEGNTGNLTRTGYRFGGWRNSQDGTIYSGGEQFTIQSNVTLTAQWLEDGGGSTSTSSSRSSSGSSGSSYSAPAKTQLPESAFSWDGKRTLTIDHDNITSLGLLAVRWDGKELTRGTDYSVYSGSIIVRFDQDFLDKQTSGNHTVRVELLRQYGEATVWVGETEQADSLPGNVNDNPGTGAANNTTENPNTGDSGGGWIALLLGSLSVAVLVSGYKEKSTQ